MPAIRLGFATGRSIAKHSAYTHPVSSYCTTTITPQRLSSDHSTKTASMATHSKPIWFITGASGGFGNAIAKEALRRGHKVIATARKTSSMADLSAAGASVLALDITSDDAAIATVAKEANSIYGGITHLVNCVGYILEGMIEETSTQEVYDAFNTSVFGTLRVIRAVLPYIRETSSAVPKVVANTGSSGSWTAWPSTGIYCGTKWAISGLTEGLAAELAPHGIKAVIIEPGTFRTDFHSSDRRKTADRRLPVYKKMRDTIHGYMNQAHGTQPGDVEKAGRTIIDVLTASGSAEGRELPVRLLLGSDCLNVVEGKCKDTLKIIGEWSAIIKSTDHDSM